MAAIESNTKSSLHIRCNSLPSAPHPLVSQFEELLNRLKSSENASSSSSSSISHKFNGLQDLHECNDKLLQLSITKQALTRECSDELLDGSLRLLDICGIAKDCLEEAKESVHEIQSSIRRRRGTESGFTFEASKYLASRKNTKKAIRKALGSLKGMKIDSMVSSENKENDMLGILKEAEAVTVNTLESLWHFIYPKEQSKQSKWSAISKLMQPKRVSCDSEKLETNEFEKVDAALKSLITPKPTSSIHNFQSHMKDLEMCIQDLEVGLESLSRQLIKTRVSLLNIFNH